MKLQNDMQLLISSQGKLFKVEHVCRDDAQANRIMANDDTVSCITEDDEGRVYLALKEPLLDLNRIQVIRPENHSYYLLTYNGESLERSQFFTSEYEGFDRNPYAQHCPVVVGSNQRIIKAEDAQEVGLVQDEESPNCWMTPQEYHELYA